jgi:hypothetical protein
VPDLGWDYLWGELPYSFDGLLSTSRTIFHSDDQYLVYLLQPTEGLGLLLFVGNDSIFHKETLSLLGSCSLESQQPHTDKRNQNSTEPIENIFATFRSRSGSS